MELVVDNKPTKIDEIIAISFFIFGGGGYVKTPSNIWIQLTLSNSIFKGNLIFEYESVSNSGKSP